MPAEIWRAAYQFSSLPPPVGNNGLTGLTRPELTRASNDRMAVVYQASGSSSVLGVTSSEMRLRIVDPFGNPIGTEVSVATATADSNSFTGTIVTAVDATTLSDGRIVVTYNRETLISLGVLETNVVFRMFNSDGSAASGEQILNINAVFPTNGNQSGASAAAFSDGTFAAVWTETTDHNSTGGDGSGSGIYLQRFGNAAQALGSLILVNTTTTGDQKYPSITTLADGNALVTWSSGDSIYGQRISSGGALVGSEVLLATFPAGTAAFGGLSSKVVGLTGGGFALVINYTEAGNILTGNRVEVQIFSAEGIAVGPRHLVQTVAPAFVIRSMDAAATPDGGVSVVVGWSDFLPNTQGLTRAHVLANGALDASGVVMSAQPVPGPQGSTGGAIGVFADGRELLMWDQVDAASTDGLQALILDDRPTSLYGSTTDDIIVGGEAGTSRANNVIVTLGGNDTAYGMGGQDYLYMGAGNDVAVGGAGVDVLLGEACTDTIYGGDDTDYIFGGSGTGNILAGEGGVDALYAEGTNDTMFGGAGGDYFYAYPGAVSPTAFGGDGNDIYTDLSGGAGANDIFYGEAGQDYMYGLAGNDTFYGGTGVDVFSGGDGDDVFDGGTDIDYAWGGNGNDRYIITAANGPLVINDFVAGGTDDTVALAGSGLTSFAQVQAAMTYYAAFDTTILTIDADTSVWFIGVTAPSLTAADFTF